MIYNRSADGNCDRAVSLSCFCSLCDKKMKEAVITHQNKPVRERAETLGVARSAVWLFGNSKTPERPQETTVVDDRK